MRKIMSGNISYFFKEVKTSIKLNLVPNLFSLISIGLIFFILAMIVSAWWAGEHVLKVIQEEAEINVFYEENLKEMEVGELKESIERLEGVRHVYLVDEEEAYRRMAGLLDKEAYVLEFFEHNPFSPFLEVNIDLEKMEPVLQELPAVAGIEHIRDNREVLADLQNIVQIFGFLGYLAILAVSTSTLLITSHIIRLGIYARREHITTLRLLGAPESFIAVPFLMEGVLLALGGALLAVLMIVLAVNFVYAQVTAAVPFIPLLSAESLILTLSLLMVCLSMVFGFIGSAIGLLSSRKV